MSSKETLAGALERIADALSANPSAIIGLKVVASSDGKGGNVTGMKVVAVGSPGSGNVTGLKVSVTAGGGPNPADVALIKELRDAAATVRADSGAKSWVDSIFTRVKDLGNKALESVVDAAVKAAASHYGV